jgi:hypothetical protein
MGNVNFHSFVAFETIHNNVLLRIIVMHCCQLKKKRDLVFLAKIFFKESFAKYISSRQEQHIFILPSLSYLYKCSYLFIQEAEAG